MFRKVARIALTAAALAGVAAPASAQYGRGFDNRGYDPRYDQRYDQRDGRWGRDNALVQRMEDRIRQVQYRYQEVRRTGYLTRQEVWQLDQEIRQLWHMNWQLRRNGATWQDYRILDDRANRVEWRLQRAYQDRDTRWNDGRYNPRYDGPRAW